VRPPRRSHTVVGRFWRVLLLLSIVPVLAQASEDIATGVTLFEHGQFASAQQFFEEFVNEYPTNAVGPYYLGRLAFERQRYDQAIAWLEKAVHLDRGIRTTITGWDAHMDGRRSRREGRDSL